MKQNTTEELIQTMEKSGLIPVFYHPEPEVCKEVVAAAYRAGVRVFEFTNRGENALELFKELVKSTKSYEHFTLGIGTIFSAADAHTFMDAGAKFVVSPALIPEVADYCIRKDVLWIPGCGTVTEIYNARKLGAKVIKIFPGNVLGSGFIKAVKAVFPEVRMMPTGGVAPSQENLASWFNAGVCCVGMGSQLIRQEMLAANDFTALEKTIGETLGMIQKLRQ
jgi:2-dehydro-3-deoxyphosphogluconate aldolase/(4S)-4-hydroxy-2-oxoglutarate aldolase